MRWSDEKNAELRQRHGVGFEDIVVAIADDRLLRIIEHPNRDRYPNQKMMIVWIDDYAYVVPFVIDDGGEPFLKTLYPSRVWTKTITEG